MNVQADVPEDLPDREGFMTMNMPVLRLDGEVLKRK